MHIISSGLYAFPFIAKVKSLLIDPSKPAELSLKGRQCILDTMLNPRIILQGL